jgi:hypothetical protein
MSHLLERKMYLLGVEAEVKSESRALEESDSLCAYTIPISMSCMHLCVPIGIQEIRRLSIDQSYEWNVDCAINTHVHATEPHVLSFEQHAIYSLFLHSRTGLTVIQSIVNAFAFVFLSTKVYYLHGCE